MRVVSEGDTTSIVATLADGTEMRAQVVVLQGRALLVAVPLVGEDEPELRRLPEFGHSVGSEWNVRTNALGSLTTVFETVLEIREARLAEEAAARHARGELPS
jgi:hypothetical protein